MDVEFIDDNNFITSIKPDYFDFNSCEIGTNNIQKMTLTNFGSDFTVDSIEIKNILNSKEAYSIKSGRILPADLKLKEEIIFEITFAPKFEDLYNAICYIFTSKICDKILNIYFDGSGHSKTNTEDNIIKPNFVLSQNPTSGILTINYSISEPGAVSFILTNSLGILIERLNNEQMLEPGNYNFNFNTEKLSSGLYFLTIKAGNYTETKKLMIFR